MKLKDNNWIWLVPYSITICVLIGLSGFHFTDSRSKMEKLPFDILPPTYFGPSESSTGPTISMYRGGILRQGIIRDESMGIQLEKVWDFGPVNLSIHTASKGSAAVDELGSYFGADSGWFYALDPEGQVRWKYYARRALYGFHGTPAIDETSVYIGDYFGNFYSFDKKSGELNWLVRVGEAVGASPGIYKGHIYIAVETNNPRNGYVVKINAATGQVAWQSPHLGEQSHCSGTFDVENNQLILGANNSKLFGVDLETGKLNWTHQMKGEIKGTLTMVDGEMYFGTWGGILYAIDARTGATNWEYKIGGLTQGSVGWVPDVDVLIIGNAQGNLFGIDRKNRVQKWQMKTRSQTSGMTSPLIIKNGKKWVAWYACKHDALCAIDPINGKILSETSLPTKLTGVPVYYDKHIYVSLNGPQGKFIKFKAVD